MTDYQHPSREPGPHAGRLLQPDASSRRQRTKVTGRTTPGSARITAEVELSPGSIRRLQQTAGNQAIAHALATRRQVVAGSAPLARRETVDQIESRQPWSQYTIESPLGPADPTMTAAIRANADLGFSDALKSRLLVRLGLPHRPHILERRFAEALRSFQSGEPTSQGTAEAGERPSPSVTATGILDEETIFALDIGGTWGLAEHGAGARAYYTQRAPWRRITAERLEAVRAAILDPLRISPADIQLVDGRVVVSDRFLAQAMNWQIWNLRSESALSWGRLGLSSLAAMGAPVQPPATAEPVSAGEETATEAPVSAGVTGAPEPAEPEEEPRDEQGLTQSQRLQLEGYLAVIDEYIGRWYERRRDEDASARDRRRTELDREIEPRLEEMRGNIDDMGLPYTDFATVFQYVRVRVRAQGVRREIRILLGQEERPAGTAPAQAATEPSPLERRSLEESMEGMAPAGYVRSQETLRQEGWDPRVWSGEGTVQQAAQAAIRGLTALRARMDTLRAAVQDGIDQPDTRLDGALLLIEAADFTAPRTLRRQWQPSLPARTPVASMADWSPQRRVQYAVSWRNRLRSAIAATDSEIRRHQGYDRPSMIVENQLAVQVDLHRSGITVTNNNGRPLRTEEMHLDPVFAAAMIRFLEQLAGLGVTEMWTAGFLRQAISAADTHPRGQACDITGFMIAGQLVHLRSGRPQAPPAEERSEDYESLRRGHSDWYDHTGTVGGMSHERVLHAITNIMRTYFSRIVGPGHNAEHQGHWHVELTQSTSRGPQVRAVALDVDQPAFVTDRADLREEGWRTPGE